MPDARPPFDPDQLRAFVAVADCQSVSRAAERLGRSQPAVSLQLRKLEARLGAPLFQRSRRRVLPTPAGERLLDGARRLLALQDELAEMAGQPTTAELVRLGAPEDFATFHLPDLLARFAAANPQIALEVACDLSLHLLDRFSSGELDLAFVKREPSADIGGGRLVWREPLAWLAARPAVAAGPGPLPLVAAPHPCVYRKRATAALDRIGRPWRVAYTCGSLAGAQAAVRAGLGVMVCPKAMAPADLMMLAGNGDLPRLDDAEVALLAARPLGPAAKALMGMLIDGLSKRPHAALS